MSEEEKIKRDIQLGKEMHTVACQTCGATVGWVHGNRYRREVESKREALKRIASLEAERDKLREESRSLRKAIIDFGRELDISHGVDDGGNRFYTVYVPVTLCNQFKELAAALNTGEKK